MATVAELEGRDIVRCFCKVNDTSSADAPQTDLLVEASTRNAGRCSEHCRRHDVTVFKYLGWASVVKIPDYDFHVSTSCQQVILIGLFRTPIYVEDVRLMALFEFSERLHSRILFI